MVVHNCLKLWHILLTALLLSLLMIMFNIYCHKRNIKYFASESLHFSTTGTQTVS